MFNSNLTPSTPEVKPQPTSAQPEAMPGTSKVNSRIRTLKRKNRRLKATIRELREDLATSEAIAHKFMDRATEERDRAGRYMAVNKEIGDLAWEAEQKVHAAQKATYAVYEPMLESFLALSKLASAVSRTIV